MNHYHKPITISYLKVRDFEVFIQNSEGLLKKEVSKTKIITGTFSAIVQAQEACAIKYP